MSSPVNANIWIGKEVEFEEDSRKKMFVDGATITEIKQALDKHDDVSELYFGHEFKERTVRYFENKISITLEVSSIDDVPSDLRGRVSVVLRLPNWIDTVKKVESKNNTVWTYEVTKSQASSSHQWNGLKMYSQDKEVTDE